MKIKLLKVLALLFTSAITSAEENSFERDRRAILNMAGEYEVTFFFKETVSLKKGYEIKPKPYSEDALEKVIVVSDTGKRIELQHVLLVDDVVKHWSQIWTYEDNQLVQFVGNNTWENYTVDEDQVTGTWTQVVTQTIDNPRYEAFGKWMHQGDSSSWTGKLNNRPLPRREYTKRSDYQYLTVTNRQTVTLAGWVHEQDNTKIVDSDGDVYPLCREVGLNTYKRVNKIDFSEVDDFWKERKPFWDLVKVFWVTELAKHEKYSLKRKVDDVSLYKALNEHSDDADYSAKSIEELVHPYIEVLKSK